MEVSMCLNAEDKDIMPACIDKKALRRMLEGKFSQINQKFHT
jgi:hypothetical protein